MKILVFGLPGSGKTTLCYRLSRQLSIPVFHLDRHFFEMGWVERFEEDFIRDVERELEKPEWIIDGNAMRTLEMRWREADLVVYCCLPRWQCLFNVFYRWLSTLGKPKPDGPNGTTNAVSWKLLTYLWNFKTRYEPIIRELECRHPSIKCVHFRSKKDLRDLKEVL